MNKFILLALMAFVVVSMVNGELDNNDDMVALNARLRRDIWRGTFKTKSDKETKYHKKVFTHKVSTNPDGEMSVDTKHHQEKGGSSESSNNSGQFAFGKHEQKQPGHGPAIDNSWFDEE